MVGTDAVVSAVTEYTWRATEPIVWRHRQNRKYIRYRTPSQQDQATATGNMHRTLFWWNSAVWFSTYASGQTDRQTVSSQYFPCFVTVGLFLEVYHWAWLFIRFHTISPIFILNNLCDLVYQLPTRTYRSLNVVAFYIEVTWLPFCIPKTYQPRPVRCWQVFPLLPVVCILLLHIALS